MTAVPTVAPDVASIEGLSAAAAAQQLAAFGPNEIEKPRTRSLWAICRGTLREPMFLLLLAASAIYLLIGDLGEGLFLVAGAGMTISLVVFQEARSEGALRALRAMAQPYARVIRDRQEQRIPARELAPGDLMLVQEGERLPADADLLSGDVLTIDESLLTGESVPVLKHPVAAGAAQPESRILAGSMVVRGSGAARVMATGARTRFGQIGASLAGGREELTPLQKTTTRLVGYLAVAAGVFCVVVFAAYGLMRGDWLQGALSALTVAISLLPEEFPMVLAIFLALGAWRLARHNVLVRRSAAIEALGGATILCVDKTGTLTVNKMELARAWVNGRASDLRKGLPADAGVASLLQSAALASAVHGFDPMDRAILASATIGEAADTREPGRTWPLRPERLAVIQVWRSAGGDIAAAKGAPETIFRMCGLSTQEIATVHLAVEAMAADGLRVLGVASATYPSGFPSNPDDASFAFAGLIAFHDPIRAEVGPALAEAREAKIAVAMITGDHPATALAIAREAGIDITAGVLTGEELGAMDDAMLRGRLAHVRVFARIAPEQKLRIVEALKANGEVVAMTGDGVNDGPALQAADIGIAMGKRGSDVARESADIVLLDDSFASIVGGVRLGRRIFANLRKALTFITAVHVPLAGLALLPILLGWPPLFLPMHVVLLELVIDPACSLVFEVEPSDAAAMKRPPRRPGEALFGPGHIAFAIMQGFGVMLAIGVFYGWALQIAPETEARGAAFAGLVIANLTLALADSAGGRAGLFDRSHRAFWIISLVAAGVLAAALSLPVISDILQMSAPEAPLLGGGLLVGALAGGWFGVVRFVRRRLSA